MRLSLSSQSTLPFADDWMPRQMPPLSERTPAQR